LALAGAEDSGAASSAKPNASKINFLLFMSFSFATAIRFLWSRAIAVRAATVSRERQRQRLLSVKKSLITAIDREKFVKNVIEKSLVRSRGPRFHAEWISGQCAYTRV
jgi:hypothetical protein